MSSVRVIALSCPTGVDGVNTPEELIACCARVSNPGHQLQHGTPPPLLEYPARHGHWSPSEIASMRVRNFVPLFQPVAGGAGDNLGDNADYMVDLTETSPKPLVEHVNLEPEKLELLFWSALSGIFQECPA